MELDGTKVEENGPRVASEITKEDVKEMIEPFNKQELIEILQGAATCHVDTVLEEIRKRAELKDPAGKNLFVADLAPDTTSDTLRTIFSSFGEVEECEVRHGAMMSRVIRGETRSFGLVTFRHIDGAQRALKVPWKEIEGKMTESKRPWAISRALPMATRTIRVGNVSSEMTKDRLLARFAQFGEIEEGPHGFDKSTGRFQLNFGFSEIVYKSADSAERSSKEPIFRIDGNQMYCHLFGGRRKQNTGGTSRQAVNEELGQLRGELNEELTPGRNQADEQFSQARQNQSPVSRSDWRNSEFWDRPFTRSVQAEMRQRVDDLVLNGKPGPDMHVNWTKVEEDGPPVSVEITKEEVREMIEPFNNEELIEILHGAATLHVDVLKEIRKVEELKDRDVSKKILDMHLNGTEVEENGAAAIGEIFLARLPIPSMVNEARLVYVNAKQYYRILRRRESRAKENFGKEEVKPRKRYMHESRHLHALRRLRGIRGRFASMSKSVEAVAKVENRPRPPDGPESSEYTLSEGDDELLSDLQNWMIANGDPDWDKLENLCFPFYE